MKKETLLKTTAYIKEHNDELWKILRTLRKVQKGESKTKKEITVEDIQEVLILITILLSGNIKVRYELEEYIKDNKAFANLSTLKSISSNCKQDIDALKSESFNMVELLKSIRQKEEEKKYKEQAL